MNDGWNHCPNCDDQTEWREGDGEQLRCSECGVSEEWIAEQV